MSSLVKVAQENVFVSGPFPTEKIDKDFERSDSTIEGPSLSTSLIINQYKLPWRAVWHVLPSARRPKDLPVMKYPFMCSCLGTGLGGIF